MAPEGQAAFLHAHAVFLDGTFFVSQEHLLTLPHRRKDSVGMVRPSQNPQISATWVPFTDHPNSFPSLLLLYHASSHISTSRPVDVRSVHGAWGHVRREEQQQSPESLVAQGCRHGPCRE